MMQLQLCIYTSLTSVDEKLTLWRTRIAEHCSSAPISLCGFHVTESALHHNISSSSSSSSQSENHQNQQQQQTTNAQQQQRKHITTVFLSSYRQLNWTSGQRILLRKAASQGRIFHEGQCNMTLSCGSRAACCYWEINDFVCCIHRSRDSQCFSMGRTTPKITPSRGDLDPI